MEKWIYDEFKHCGVDYDDPDNAAQYDEKHNKFRDYEKETAYVLHELALRDSKSMTLIDLGCGTGAFAVHAAKHFRKIYAVDVSEAMINRAKEKTVQHDGDIIFINAGFLTYEHADEPADIVLSSAALHHMPDFWKQVALLRINKMLKLHGIFYLFDIVFQFKPEEYVKNINDYISNFSLKVGKDFCYEVETHVRDEYSTFDWIMRGMITNAGFTIKRSKSPDGFSTEYICVKEREV